jgi:hypothetical protein
LAHVAPAIAQDALVLKYQNGVIERRQYRPAHGDIAGNGLSSPSAAPEMT